MNSIALRTGGTGLISREDLKASLNNAAMSMPAVGGENQYLKMDKNNGEWLYGQEETIVDPKSLWALDPRSICHGWVAWDTNAGGAPVEEIMVPISRPMPPLASLPQLPMGTPDKKGRADQLEYQEQRSAVFVCIDGEDEGVSVEYKQSSTGAMKLFNALVNALLTQVEKGDDIVAIGRWNSKPYDHKKYGTIINPLFDIVEWRTLDDTSAPAAKEAPAAAVQADAGAADDDDEKLAREYAATAAEKEAEAPVPRRRMRRG